MKSVMEHNFSRTPDIKTPRSLFDRSHGYKTTFDAGKLIPFYWDEVYPGDTFNCNASIFARLNTLSFPLIDNLFLDTHFFFVPYRIIWDNSRKFFGEQIDPGDSIDYTVPLVKMSTGTAEGSLMDYLGAPLGIANHELSALPMKSYYKIWDEWFRDQNLQNSVDIPSTDTTYTLSTGGSLSWRGKRHDYFTSALTTPQKGAAVSLPLGTSADVKYGTNISGSDWEGKWYVASSNATPVYSHSYGDTVGVNTGAMGASGANNLVADLTNATAATINDLREAFQVQKLLERDARGGTRYAEVVRNHFGVDFYDVSYRPEFLGGGTTPINITQVASSSNATGAQLGDLGAFGIAADTGHGFTKSFVEHGIVMGLVSVRADQTYSQGAQREFLRSTRYDFYWPSLAHLGEQAITNEEIYADGSANDDLVFGYQERYAELRYKPSKVTNALRHDAAASLDAWHLGIEHSSLPTLGDTFIRENPPLDRCVATPSEPHFLMDAYINLKCARPMPVFGVPGMIDHF